jgi:hypothetical protein
MNVFFFVRVGVNDGSHRCFLFHRHPDAKYRGRVYGIVLWDMPGFWTDDVVEWYALTSNVLSDANNVTTDYDKMCAVARMSAKGYSATRILSLVVSWNVSIGKS